MDCLILQLPNIRFRMMGYPKNTKGYLGTKSFFDPYELFIVVYLGNV